MDYSNFLTHGFLVDDALRAGEYYHKLFPAPLRQNLDTFVEMETESPCGLYFWKYDHLARHLGPEAMAKVKHRVMCNIQYKTREEVDAAYEDLKGKGVEFLAAPQEWKWNDDDPDYAQNAYAGFFVDPFGYAWELWVYG